MMITEIVTVIIESSSTDQQMWYDSDAAGTDTGCAYAADADDNDEC